MNLTMFWHVLFLTVWVLTVEVSGDGARVNTNTSLVTSNGQNALNHSMFFFAVPVVNQLSRCAPLLKDIDNMINEFNASVTEIRSQMGSIQGKEAEYMSRFLDLSQNYTDTAAMEVHQAEGNDIKRCHTGRYKFLKTIHDKMHTIFNKFKVINAKSKMAGDETERMIQEIGDKIKSFIVLHNRVTKLLNDNKNISTLDHQIFEYTMKEQEKVNRSVEQSYKIYSGDPMKYRNNRESVQRTLKQISDAVTHLQYVVSRADPSDTSQILMSLERQIKSHDVKVNSLRQLLTNKQITFLTRRRFFEDLENQEKAIDKARETFLKYSNNVNTDENIEELQQAVYSTEQSYKLLLNIESNIRRSRDNEVSHVTSDRLVRSGDSAYNHPTNRSGDSADAQNLTINSKAITTKDIYQKLSDIVDNTMRTYHQVEALVQEVEKDEESGDFHRKRLTDIYKLINQSKHALQKYREVGSTENSARRREVLKEHNAALIHLGLLANYEQDLKNELGMGQENVVVDDDEDDKMNIDIRSVDETLENEEVELSGGTAAIVMVGAIFIFITILSIISLSVVFYIHFQSKKNIVNWKSEGEERRQSVRSRKYHQRSRHSICTDSDSSPESTRHSNYTDSESLAETRHSILTNTSPESTVCTNSDSLESSLLLESSN